MRGLRLVLILIALAAVIAVAWFYVEHRSAEKLPPPARLVPTPVPSPTPRTKIVFPLKYGSDHEMANKVSLHADFSKQSLEPQDEFTRSLNLEKGKGKYFLNSRFPEVGWIAIEERDEATVALFIDFNRDRKSSPDERLLPVGPVEGMAEFKIPESAFKQNNIKREFRITYSEGRVFWASDYCYTGTAEFKGNKYQIILPDGIMDCDPAHAYEGSYYLAKPGDDSARSKELSRLIQFDNGFYEMSLSPEAVTLEKSSLPLGRLRISVQDFKDPGWEIRTANVHLQVPEQNIVLDFNFSNANPEVAIPALSYIAPNANLIIGKTGEFQNRGISFQAAIVNIFPGYASLLSLGKPIPQNWATTQERALDTNPPIITASETGQSISFQQILSAPQGVTYTNFSESGTGAYGVKDSSGTLIANGDLRHLKAIAKGFTWQTQGLPPGKYTIAMTQDTGPIAGVLEGQLEFTLSPPFTPEPLPVATPEVVAQTPAPVDPLAAAEAEMQKDIYPGAFAMGLKYLGLTSTTAQTYGAAAWHTSKSEKDPPDDFMKGIDVMSKEVRYEMAPLYLNANFSAGPKWVAVEYLSGKAVALYIDINADNELSPDEVISPAGKLGDDTLFITPDLSYTASDGRTMQYRYMVCAGMAIRWSSACVLEGSAAVAGKSYHLVLFDSAMDGKFSEIGKDNYLLATQEQIDLGPSQLESRPVARIVQVAEGPFYQMDFARDGSQVSFGKLRQPLGGLKVAAAARPEMILHAASLRLVSLDTPEMFYDFPMVNKRAAVVPSGKYRLESGELLYSTPAGELWRCGYEMGSGLSIEAGKSAPLDLGKVSLFVYAVRDGEPITSATLSYAKGAAVRFYCEARGAAGERYVAFGPRGGGAMAPTIKIVDASSAAVASGNIQDFGADGKMEGFLWKTPATPGAYTASVTIDTGALAGVVEGKIILTVE